MVFLLILSIVILILISIDSILSLFLFGLIDTLESFT